MNGNIYKVVPGITKEEILQNCEYEEIPDYGDVMSYEEFMEAVNSYCITDYDGSGDLVLFDKVVKRTSAWIANKTVYFTDKFFVPFETLYKIFGNDVKFVWFNK